MVEHRVVPIDDSVVSEILPVADTFDDSKTIIMLLLLSFKNTLGAPILTEAAQRAWDMLRYVLWHAWYKHKY